MRILRGKVVSGFGNFSYWIERLEEHYYQKTRLHLYPGTLNVQLDYAYDLPKDLIRFEKEEYGGEVSVSIQPCQIFDRTAFILRTDRNAADHGDHPRSIIEIATDVKLRDVYKLRDGDVVEIVVG